MHYSLRIARSIKRIRRSTTIRSFRPSWTSRIEGKRRYALLILLTCGSQMRTNGCVPQRDAPSCGFIQGWHCLFDQPSFRMDTPLMNYNQLRIRQVSEPAVINLSMGEIGPMYHVRIGHAFLKDVCLFPSLQDLLGRFVAPNKLLSSYSWDGCRDYAALLCMPSALSLWGALARNLREEGPKSDQNSSSSGSRNNASGCRESAANSSNSSSFNLSNIREHNQKTLFDATEMLSYEWGVHRDSFAAPHSMRIGSPMSLVSQ